MGQANKVSVEMADEFVRLYKLEWRLVAIGARFNVAGNTVKIHLHKRGVYDPKRGNSFSCDQKTLTEVYLSNVPVEEIALRLKMPEHRVYTKLTQFGVPRRGAEGLKRRALQGASDQEVVAKYQELKNPDLTAKWFKTSRTTIYAILRRNQILPIKKERGERIDREKDRIHHLYFKKYWGFRQIGQEYNMNPTQICKRFRKWGWKAREATVHDTQLERDFAAILDGLKIIYLKQYKVEGSYFDFYLPSYNLLIETHGDYWHGNPMVYSELDRTQLKKQKTDREKWFLSKRLGYRLLTFWENEVTERPVAVKTILSKTLKELDSIHE